MPSPERYDWYLEERERYILAKRGNLARQDAIIIQLSVGLLAIMATLGKDILAVDKFLSQVMMIALLITLSQAVLGFWLSDRFYSRSLQLLNDNLNKKGDILKGQGDLLPGKFNRFINHSIIITFGIALIMFLLLVFGYLETIKYQNG